MGLLQTQKEIATKTGYPLYYCQDLPPRTLFKKASIEGNSGIQPVYVDIKEAQGILHIRNGILTNFMLTPGFYFIDNTTPTTYGYGQHSFILTPEQLRLHSFPLLGEHVYFVNLKPISDVIVDFEKPITYNCSNGLYNVNCKLSFDVCVSNPVALFKTVVKNGDTEHYLTENLFQSISNMLRKHVLQQFEIFSKQNVSHNFLKQNKIVLLQNFEQKTSSLLQIGLSIVNIEIDELLFTLPPNNDIPANTIYAQPQLTTQHSEQTNVAFSQMQQQQPNSQNDYQMQQFYNQNQNQAPQQMRTSAFHQEFNVSDIGTPQEPYRKDSVKPETIEGLNLSFEEDNAPMYTQQNYQNQSMHGNAQSFTLFSNEWLCPSCKNEASGNVCGFCGYRREVGNQPIIPAPTQNGQWQCNNCGLVNSLKFCSNCGSPKPVQNNNVCKNCGYRPENPNMLPKFCPECGSKF